MEKSKQILLHVSLVNGAGPATVMRIVESLGKDNLGDLYYMDVDTIVSRFGCSVKSATALCYGLKDYSLLNRELELLDKHGIEWIGLLDDDYPSLLRQIYLPPLGLYVRGNKELLYKKSLAIVGSRKADFYGKRAVDNFVPALVAHDFVIVSGGALGLDAMAHQATLGVKGSTVSVVGSGLLRLYPAANKRLFENIVEMGGALVSPFPLQMEAAAQNFPARNRIIAGLSIGCFVVQAAAKSGARITAQFALDQGKHVFALPGQWDHPLSQGCHDLIAQGAVIAMNPEAIMTDLGEKPQEEADSETTVLEVNDNFLVELTIEEKVRRACLRPVSVDDLARHLELSLIEVQSLLFNLQLEGQIAQNFAGLWQTL